MRAFINFLMEISRTLEGKQHLEVLPNQMCNPKSVADIKIAGRSTLSLLQTFLYSP